MIFSNFCDVVLMPDVYEEYRTIVKTSKFLRVHGELQKVENAKHPGAYAISIKANEIFPLEYPKIETRSRDFH